MKSSEQCKKRCEHIGNEMFEENETAMMLILMSSTGQGTIHFVGSEDGRRVNWNLGDYGLNCKVWAKEMD